MSGSLVLFGAGGLGLEVVAALHALGPDRAPTLTDVIDEGEGRLDEMAALVGHAPRTHRSVRTVEGLADKLALVALGDPATRARKFGELREQGARFAVLIHPLAHVAPGARIGAGCFVAPFAYIGPGAVLEDNVLVNVRATIGHDTSVGAHGVISPHANINGDVTLGRETLVASSTAIQRGVSIGAGCKIAAGSVVTVDFEAGCLIHGNPAKGRRMFAVAANG